MSKRTDLDKLEKHLKNVREHLELAISELGNSVGGIDGWVGSWAEYKRLVKTNLKLSCVFERIEGAKLRAERRKRWESKNASS